MFVSVYGQVSIKTDEDKIWKCLTNPTNFTGFVMSLYLRYSPPWERWAELTVTY